MFKNCNDFTSKDLADYLFHKHNLKFNNILDFGIFCKGLEPMKLKEAIKLFNKSSIN